nr:PREDICTED: guanylin-like [Lepisosteus oculatus]
MPLNNMKSVSAVVLCFVVFSVLSDAVWVKEGNFTFSLESVKTLKSLMDSSAGRSLRLAKTSSVAVCDNPALPMEFQPLCHQPGAGMAFFRLASVDHDICEICAFAACTGC